MTNTNTQTVSAIVATTKARKAVRKAKLPKTAAMIKAEANEALRQKAAKGRNTRADKIEASRERGRKAADVVPYIPALRTVQTKAEMTLVEMCEAITTKCQYTHWNTMTAETPNTKVAYAEWTRIRKALEQAAFFEGYEHKNHYVRLLCKAQAELIGDSNTRTKKDDDVHTRDTMKSLYKRLMKIPSDKVTPEQLRRSDFIGRFLMDEFKIDLSSLNV